MKIEIEHEGSCLGALIAPTGSTSGYFCERAASAALSF
jgi:hypothetical protein